jgi:hypothetical protein
VTSRRFRSIDVNERRSRAPLTPHRERTPVLIRCPRAYTLIRTARRIARPPVRAKPSAGTAQRGRRACAARNARGTIASGAPKRSMDAISRFALTRAACRTSIAPPRLAHREVEHVDA